MNFRRTISRTLLVSTLLVAAASAGVVIDQMAVIVGKRVIKTSDIDLDQRLTAFLNNEPVKTTSEEKRRSAERLIDQEIIRQEILTGGFRRPEEAQSAALEAQLTRDRFGGSEARRREALGRYGLGEDDLREQLLWQLTVLSFIDQRFRTSAIVSDEDVRAYYDQRLPELRRQNPQAYGYEALEAKIRSSLEGERVNQSFNQWLGEARNRYRIEYKQEALK